MEKIGLLLDSTAITRNDILPHPFVRIVSLNVQIDGVDMRDADIPLDRMIGFLHTAKKMTTSQPSPGDFLHAYQRFHEEGYTHVLVLVLSDKISGTYQSALLAKGMVDFPLALDVYAPQVASFGVALGAMPLIDMIAAGASFRDVSARARSVYADAKVLFTLSDLMNLFRGGRLNRVSALIGTVLRIKPIIEMIDGKLQLTKRERTNAACYEYFHQKIVEYRAIHQKVTVDVIHMNRAEWADRLAEAVAREFPDVVVHRTYFVSPVFHIHLGDEGFGIAMIGE
jgi:DegV family protein with EDD domain